MLRVLREEGMKYLLCADGAQKSSMKRCFWVVFLN